MSISYFFNYPSVVTLIFQNIVFLIRSKGVNLAAFAIAITCGIQNGFGSDRFVFVEGDTFVMQRFAPCGDPYGEGQRTRVGDYWIEKYPVTLRNWKEVKDWGEKNGYNFGFPPVRACGDNHPVGEVSWYQAVIWSNARSEMEGLVPVYYTDADKGEVYRMGMAELTNAHVKWNADGYRLPTAAEWQFAALGGKESKGYIYSGSNNLDDVGWYRDNSYGSECGDYYQIRRGTWPVGEKDPNELGIYDMSGNVNEWYWDRVMPEFLGDEKVLTDPRGPDIGARRGKFGGTWNDSECFARIGVGGAAPPHSASAGFRNVLSFKRE